MRHPMCGFVLCVGYLSVHCGFRLHGFPIEPGCVAVGIEGLGKIEAKGGGAVDVEMFQPGIALFPIDWVIRRDPPGYVLREFGLLKPLPSFGECFSMRPVVGECGHRFEVLPETEGHRNVFLRWRSGEAGGKFDLAPGMKPRSHVANGACVKSIPGIGCLLHVRYAVYKSLNLRVTHRLTQNSHGHES